MVGLGNTETGGRLSHTETSHLIIKKDPEDSAQPLIRTVGLVDRHDQSRS
jgi:hypothetical protein